MTMEKISNELKLVELKKESVTRMCQQLHKRSSDLLLFTMHWKELEEHFDDIGKGIEAKFSEVKAREREIDERFKVIELKESQLGCFEKKIKECEDDVVKMEEKLGLLEKGFEERSIELEEKERRLVLTRTAVDVLCLDVVHKENEVSELRKSIEECSRVLSLRRGELDSLNRTLKERTEELGLKKDDLSLVENMLEDKRRDVDSEHKKLALVQEKLGECSEQLELRTEKLASVEKALGERERSIELKSEGLCSLDKDLEFIADNIKKCQDKLKLKEQQYASIQISIDACSEEFDAKQKELAEVKMSLKKCSEELESKQKELKLIEEKQSNQLQSRHDLGIMEVSHGYTNATSHGPVKTEPLGDFPVYHASDTLAMLPNFQPSIGKRSLRSSRIEPLDESRTYEEILDALHLAEDPANFVLEIIEGSCRRHLQREVIGLQNDVVRTHISLLKQLMIVAPPITEHVKNGARKLATEWKLRLDHANPENHMEVLRFLHLLATYELVSLFRKAEILRLVEVVSPSEKATELCHALGFTEKITDATASTSDPKSNSHHGSKRKRGSRNAPVDIQVQSDKRRYALRTRQVPNIKNECD